MLNRFLLDPLGLVNAGDSFKPKDGKPNKGHFPLRKTKGGVVLDPLIEADPDVIVMTGDAFVVQRALATCKATNPALARVKAVQNMALYAPARVCGFQRARIPGHSTPVDELAGSLIESGPGTIPGLGSKTDCNSTVYHEYMKSEKSDAQIFVAVQDNQRSALECM